MPPAAERRFEALAVGASLSNEPRVARLLAELAGAGVLTAVLAGRGVPVRSNAHAHAATLAVLAELWWSRGIRPSEALILAEADPPEPGRSRQPDARGPAFDRGEPPAGPPWLTASPELACAIMTDQLRRRAGLDLPAVPAESSWTVVVDGVEPDSEPARDVRLAMVDGVTGTLGSPLVAYGPTLRDVYVAGVYRGTGSESRLARIPDWTRLAGRLDDRQPARRVLDLRTGLLHHDLASDLGRVRAVSFASRARPGIGVLRAAGDGARSPSSGPLAPTSVHDPKTPLGEAGARIRGAAGGAAIAARETRTGRGESRRVERLVAVRASGGRAPGEAAARSLLAEAAEAGFDRLLAEQRAAWASRWADADIRIEGDPDMQRAMRFALFALMAHAPDRGEAAVGARGVTGPKYRGHVFWDTDVFMLPFLVAARPRAARAVLEYRIRRLGAARAAAAEAGFTGAWFPWESAADGRDVTPDWITGGDGLPLRVLTGGHELHIVSDVAWAAAVYADWTGDRAFAAGPGGELLYEAARFWASRFERAADGSAHLAGVIGPDEYHNFVRDNAYTNVMARWNLRRAAKWADAIAESAGRGGAGHGNPPTPGEAEREAWLELAGRIADGFDPATGLYEQFDGFFDLEPVKIPELATRPLSGEVFLGRERVAATQCVKQPDVLMLYHLVPEELAPGTLATNIDFYDPRTAHGSSLSPGIHAALLARAGRTAEALAALRMVAFIDLADEFHRTAEGLHMAAMGSLWQAVVLGFAGLRPAGDELTVDPHLPPGWSALELPFRLRGRRIRVRIEPDRLAIRADRPVTVRVAGAAPVVADRTGTVLLRRNDGWSSEG